MGWCETSDGRDQNSGTRRLWSSSKSDCHHLCKDVTEATACEWYSPAVGADICLVHTEDVAQASTDTQDAGWRYHRCWIFNSEPEDMQN